MTIYLQRITKYFTFQEKDPMKLYNLNLGGMFPIQTRKCFWNDKDKSYFPE